MKGHVKGHVKGSIKGNAKANIKDIKLSKYMGYLLLLTMLIITTGCQSIGLKPLRAKDFFKDKQIIELAKQIGRGRISKIEQAVNSGVDINTVGKEGMTLLLWAMYSKNKQGYVKLLELGASSEIKIKTGSSVMSYSAGAKDSFYLEQALKHGGDPNTLNEKRKIFPTPIYDAMAELNLDNVKILVNANANIEQTDYRQFTPILYAAHINQWHIVYYLLEQGANYKKLDQWGFGLVYSIEENAIAKGGDLYRARAKVIEFLKQKGIEVNPKFP